MASKLFLEDPILEEPAIADANNYGLQVGTPLSLPEDQYAMAISNYDQFFGPKTLTDAFGTTRTLAALNRPDLYTGTMDTITGQPTGSIDVGFQNALRDAAIAEQLRANQLNQNYGQFFRNQPVTERNFFTPINEGIASLKTNLGEGWEFAKQLPGMAMGALTGIPGVGMALGLLRNIARPDSPYQTFQKQIFEDMGWQGDPNKDPWGKNIRSLKDTYDVREQWSDLMGSKIGEKYGYEQAFADGVLSDEELAQMQAKGLKGWQLNRAIGLSKAAKKAQDWKDKKAEEKIITNKMKNLDGGKTTSSWKPTGHYGKKQGTTGSWAPSGTYTGPAKQRDYSKHSAYGLKDGGLVSLFTRRG